ncbi:hypothetical protein D3C76_222370 [compost metagenome]
MDEHDMVINFDVEKDDLLFLIVQATVISMPNVYYPVEVKVIMPSKTKTFEFQKASL